VVKFLFLLLLLSPTTALSDEFRDRVLIIDSGIDSMNHLGLCRDGHKDFSNTGMHDSIDHGSIVYKIASDNVNYSKFCFTIIKWADDRQPLISDDKLVEIIKYAATLHPKFVNLSTDGLTDIPKERSVIQLMVDAGTEFFVAAGNYGRNLTLNCNVFPACYDITKLFNVVSAVDTNGNKLPFSNFGRPAVYSKLGVYVFNGKQYSGTSFAAPAALNEKLRE